MNIRNLLFNALLEAEYSGDIYFSKEEITAEINRRLTWARSDPNFNSLRVYCEQMNDFAWNKISKKISKNG